MRAAFAIAALLSLSANAVIAQQDATAALTIEPLWPADQFLSGREALELRLSRKLQHGSERLALVVGALDVSAVVDVRGTTVRYQPNAVRLPNGQSSVVAYLVTSAGEWNEIGRFPLNVRTRVGLEQGKLVPSVDLSSNGQLDRSIEPNIAAPDRRTYQDLTLRLGVDGMFGQSGWQLTTQANVLGVSEETQRLRWTEKQGAAPGFDLSDYRVQLTRGPTQLSLGNVSAGNNRYLLSGFSSRGVGGGLRIGRFAAVDAAVLNGTSVVGWSNLLGLSQSDHQMASLNVALELVPMRPGGAHVDISGFQGSLLPVTSFNQGAATDAEESRGMGVQVALSTPSQRVRVGGGFSSSTFDNPADPLLAMDTAIVPVRETTRTARYGELDVQLLNGFRITTWLPFSLGAGLRHERVEPLFRSVGAQVQADAENNGLNLNAMVGPVSLQALASGTRDNLDEIESILTTRTRNRSVNGAVGIGTLLGASADAWYWPNLAVSWQRLRQFGEAVPSNSDFAPTHVPDQASTTQSANVSWTRGQWNLSYSWNQSFQDNRQTGREQADFRAATHTVGLGMNPSKAITANIDYSTDRQRNLEANTTQRMKRVGIRTQLQLTRNTAVSGTSSHNWGFQPYGDQHTRNTDYNIELSQGVTVYGRRDRGSQGRIFIRYASRRATLTSSEAFLTSPGNNTWTLNAGASFRLY